MNLSLPPSIIPVENDTALEYLIDSLESKCKTNTLRSQSRDKKLRKNSIIYGKLIWVELISVLDASTLFTPIASLPRNVCTCNTLVMANEPIW